MALQTRSTPKTIHYKHVAFPTKSKAKLAYALDQMKIEWKFRPQVVDGIRQPDFLLVESNVLLDQCSRGDGAKMQMHWAVQGASVCVLEGDTYDDDPTLYLSGLDGRASKLSDVAPRVFSRSYQEVLSCFRLARSFMFEHLPENGGSGETEVLKPTYKGLTFRSRTEARFAAFLDARGIDYRYEPDALQLASGQTYLPDFVLDATGQYIEVKGALSEEEQREGERRWRDVCRSTGKPLAVVVCNTFLPENVLVQEYKPLPRVGGGFETQFAGSASISMSRTFGGDLEEISRALEIARNLNFDSPTRCRQTGSVTINQTSSAPLRIRSGTVYRTAGGWVAKVIYVMEEQAIAIHRCKGEPESPVFHDLEGRPYPLIVALPAPDGGKHPARLLEEATDAEWARS